MKMIAISEFKAHALKVLGEVAETKEPVVVTKRGEPLAEVIPFRGSDDRPRAGKLASALVFEGDIVSPIGEQDWGVCK